MAEWLGVILAAVAITVSIWTAVRQQRVQNRMAAIEAERRSEEVAAKGQADITAFFEPRVTSSGDVGKSLVLENRGLAPARAVSFEIVPIGEGDSPMLVGSGLDTSVPVIDAGGRYGWPVAFAWGTAAELDVHIQWTDDGGEKHKELRFTTIG